MTSTSVDTRQDSSARARPRAHRGLPPEIAATILALSAVALGALFSVPAFGIFFGWAAASLTVGIPRAPRRVLARCLVVGSLFGAGTLAAQAALTPMLGDDVPTWVLSLAVLAIANPLMIALGRIPAVGSVPGMFIGFSTILAVHLGGLAPVADSIVVSFLSSIATNLIGVTFVWIYARLTGARTAAAPRATEREPRLRT